MYECSTFKPKMTGRFRPLMFSGHKSGKNLSLKTAPTRAKSIMSEFNAFNSVGNNMSVIGY
jgi:hypothetical protein